VVKNSSHPDYHMIGKTIFQGSLKTIPNIFYLIFAVSVMVRKMLILDRAKPGQEEGSLCNFT
jgi:hypothetical protein